MVKHPRLKPVSRWTGIVLFGVISLGCFLQLAFAQPAEKQTLAIVPFQINSEKDYDFLSTGIQSMLTSRLHLSEAHLVVMNLEKYQSALHYYPQPLTPSSARALGQEIKADYVLYGSLTFFGESVSIDGQLVEVHGPETVKHFFSQTENINDLLLLVNDFALNITAKAMWAVSPAPRDQVPPVAVAPPETDVKTDPNMPTEQQKPGSPFVMADRTDSPNVWRSPEFNLHLKGLASADVTGNGQAEVILIANRHILIYRFTANGFAAIEKIELKRHQQLISVDAADINGSGRAEIFLTCLNTTRQTLASFVLEYDGQQFITRAENQNWYYRVLSHIDGSPMLLAQKRGISDLFWGGVQELTWQSERYLPVRELQLPDATNIYNFTLAPLVNQKQSDIVILDDKQHLRLYHENRQRWKSPERYGGSEQYLEHIRQPEKRYYLPQRLLPVQIHGTLHLVVVSHDSLTGRLFERIRHYTSASFAGLKWADPGLTVNWQTHKISGYISDYVVADIYNDGHPELAALLVERREGLTQPPESYLVVYRLAALDGLP